MTTSTSFDSKQLVAIWDECTAKFGPTPVALTEVAAKMEAAITGAYSDAAFKNLNRDSIPGIMRKYDQIWRSACDKITKKHPIEINKDFWSNRMLKSFPAYGQIAFPGRQDSGSFQIF